MTQGPLPVEPVLSDLTPAGLTGFKPLGFFPADYAKIESGKVYASGGYWGVLQFPAFPATMPFIYLVAVIQIPYHAYSADHRFEMGMRDFDDKATGFKVEAVFRSAPTIHAKFGQAGTVPVAVALPGLRFERPGEYAFTLSVDGPEIARYPFVVLQVPMAVGLQAPVSPSEG